MKSHILTASIALLSSQAHALSGYIIDSNGRPIANASVDIIDSKTTLKTNAEGQFAAEQGPVDELHIYAEGYSHKVLHLHGDSAAPLKVVLTRSIIEQVDVIGIPLHASVIESAQPIAVLSGRELRNRQADTLGDSLAGEVGVHTNFHGNVASTPIIRGLSGPRVLIAQNSMDASDASRVGPDHAVASEVSTAEQVEILRGPATLFFGSGAIGGVVNVVDKRVPSDAQTRGEWLFNNESVNTQKSGAFNLNTGTGNVAMHLDGFWRDSDDYKVPVAPDTDEPDGEHRVANSAEQSQGFTLGSSYLLDKGYVGFSVGRLDREYGIPGHSHGHEEAENGHEDAPESVYADLKQDRYQIASELDFNRPWLRAINTRLGYTDYQHAEIENGRVGTVFNNQTAELRVDVLHQPFADWRGGVVLHYKNTDFKADGEEAFTPPSETESFALAIMEERHFGPVLIQLGARIERSTLEADNLLLPELELHGHEEHEEHEDEEDEHAHTGSTRVYGAEHTFTPVSVSAGAVWDFRPGYNLGVALTHSQRAPSAAELLSFGPHIGTGSYEVGALFDLHDEGEPHFDIHNNALELETANNIDLTLRKHEGDFGFILNAFYNQIDNYYDQSATGLFADSGHEHAEEEHDHDAAEEHSDELPVYVFTSADAILHGLEAQFLWQITPAFKATVFGDTVHAKLKDGGNLARTPPLRVGARGDYQWQQWSANVSFSRYQTQDNIAALETATDGYTELDTSVSYRLPLAKQTLELFIKGENLTNTEARVHSSFLKNLTPKPGRNISLGMRGEF
ncbi:MAG: TonB-dependent receptor [Marinagarivorans sp.]|nr:TonB-dependent receptor [Marinagarivorans sp.]